MKLARPNPVVVSLLLALCHFLPASSAAHAGQSVAHNPFRNSPAQGPSTLAQTGRDPAQFPAYVEQLKQKARQSGISPQTIAVGFDGIHFVDHAVNADRNQPEQKLTLDDYLARVMTPERISTGQENLQRYQAQLSAVASHYGVAPGYIVALWAMESHYGAIQGKEQVVSALATLAFEGRREAFFTQQLLAALKIIQREQLSAADLTGSWAGAMGQSQFMPDSFLRYGADGDGDGKIDIWNNPDDVFASSANFLASQGWQPGESWGQQVRLPDNFNRQNTGVQDGQARTVAQWQAEGVSLSMPLPDARQRAWIILPDDTRGRAFMVFDNFRTLMRWNRSYYFALSVGMMADKLAQLASTSADAS